MVEITLTVPDELGRELEQVRDRLPEVLARGLREVLAEASPPLDDERAIIQVLASQPTPQEILDVRPSPAMQQRASELLARSKQGTLSTEEVAESERYLLLEHLVRLAKGYAYRQLADQP